MASTSTPAVKPNYGKLADIRHTAPIGSDGKRIYVLPTGYTAHWPHASYDLLKRTGKTGPAWRVTCNVHGKVRDGGFTSLKDAAAAGKPGGRKSWCTGCKSA